MGDIVDKLNTFIERVECTSFIPKETAIRVIGFLQEDSPDDKVLLENTQIVIEKYWSQGNVELLENFYELLEFYNVIEGARNILENKTILEKKGNQVVRKKFTPAHKEAILDLIQGE